MLLGILLILYYLNRDIKQEDKTSKILNTPYYLFSFIYQNIKLDAEYIVLTGNPINNEEFQVGATIEVEIEGIGRIKNYVVAEKE